jgi:hypothetical protein
MKEAPLLKRIWSLSSGPVRLWRNNCGSLQDKHGRWVKFGVANPGGADLIGFKTVTVTKDMVGKRLAVFVALEVKQKNGRVRPEQQVFIDLVKLKGGIAAIVRSVEQAIKVLT